MRAMKNKGVGTYEIIVKDWGESAKKAKNAATIPTANFLSPAENGNREHFAYRQWLVYNKGAYLLACLHSEIGEEKFVQFLRGYQKSFPWYPPSFTQDVPDLLKAITDGRGNRVESDMTRDGPMGPTRMVFSKPVIAAVEGYAVVRTTAWAPPAVSESLPTLPEITLGLALPTTVSSPVPHRTVPGSRGSAEQGWRDESAGRAAARTIGRAIVEASR